MIPLLAMFFQKIKMLKNFLKSLIGRLFLCWNQTDSQLQYLHELTQINLDFFAYILSFEGFHEGLFKSVGKIIVFLFRKYRRS